MNFRIENKKTFTAATTFFYFIFFDISKFAIGQNYEVADIDCAIGTNGKELLSARLRKPDGFRGTPIFADDRGSTSSSILEVSQDLTKDAPCQIFQDPTDSTGRVFVLRVADFSQCGVLKRNGFIHVRVWFPQLHGVVMLSDQEVIIMCKPPQPTVTQSKAAGFAGSIPTGARVSGVVEETPGRLEYEVALFRETSSSNVGRSSGSGGPGTGAFITSVDSQELPVDQAVPIGTRLQLRAKISLDSAWQHAKLMEVSVSPDPKDPNAEGSVSLVKDGCRNSDLVSIIPKQPYRYKERTNEVVLDFEAFLLSNMGERNTLWLHTQIKACMEPQDCTPEFCMDVYQPSGFGRRRRRDLDTTMTFNTTFPRRTNETVLGYMAPLSQHWKSYEGSPVASTLSNLNTNISDTTTNNFIEMSKNQSEFPFSSKNKVSPKKLSTFSSKKNTINEKSTNSSTKFGDNIGFSVIMPSDYYRTSKIGLSTSYECRGWALATMITIFIALTLGIVSCVLGCRLRKFSLDKERSLFLDTSTTSCQTPPTSVRSNTESTIILECKKNGVSKQGGHHHHHHHKYARDSSVYRS